jgi:hypothetical protein
VYPQRFDREISLSLTGSAIFDSPDSEEVVIRRLKEKYRYLIEVRGSEDVGGVKCPFCNFLSSDIVVRDDLRYSLSDLFPVSRGYLLVIPFCHTPNFFSILKREDDDVYINDYLSVRN